MAYSSVYSSCNMQMKGGKILFKDALSTFYLRLYDVEHMVKNHINYFRWAYFRWNVLSCVSDDVEVNHTKVPKRVLYTIYYEANRKRFHCGQ